MKEEKKCRRPRVQERNMGQEEETEKRTKDEMKERQCELFQLSREKSRKLFKGNMKCNAFTFFFEYIRLLIYHVIMYLHLLCILCLNDILYISFTDEITLIYLVRK